LVAIPRSTDKTVVDPHRALLIRADANVAIGTGHVMRCLALAQAWQDVGGRAVFAMAETTPSLSSRLRSESMEVATIECQPAGRGDARRVAEFAQEYGADWVVVDGYHFDNSYGRELKSAGLKFLVVDDAGFNGECIADFVLNSNADAAEFMYPECKPQTRLLLGTRYVLLRREFEKWREWKRETDSRAKNLLVTMGGSDPDNLTAFVIQALEQVKTEGLQATVIAGGSNPHLGILREEVLRMRTSLRLQDSVSNMPDLMAQADMAIIAGGGTLWELMYMSCPVLSFGRTPMQRRILDDLHQRGVIQHLGDPQLGSASNLAQVIDELAASQSQRAKMAMLGRQQVDGAGARRVCNVLASSN
jgi:UDP-2,4-diacetamido-2,4,6-trideoxy-beta-L-altropyranose hydrolase